MTDATQTMNPPAPAPVSLAELEQRINALSQHRNGKWFEVREVGPLLSLLMNEVRKARSVATTAEALRRELEVSRRQYSDLAARHRETTGEAGASGLTPDAERIQAMRARAELQRSLDADVEAFNTWREQRLAELQGYEGDVQARCEELLTDAYKRADEIVAGSLDPNGLPEPATPDEMERRGELVIELFRSTRQMLAKVQSTAARVDDRLVAAVTGETAAGAVEAVG